MMRDASRRSVLRGAALTTAGALAGSPFLVLSSARAQSTAATGTNGVKALVFDVFGTVVDWRGGVAGRNGTLLKPRGGGLEWFGFAGALRALCQPARGGVRSGEVPFLRLRVV